MQSKCSLLLSRQVNTRTTNELHRPKSVRLHYLILHLSIPVVYIQFDEIETVPLYPLSWINWGWWRANVYFTLCIWPRIESKTRKHLYVLYYFAILESVDVLMLFFESHYYFYIRRQTITATNLVHIGRNPTLSARWETRRRSLPEPSEFR